MNSSPCANQVFRTKSIQKKGGIHHRGTARRSVRPSSRRGPQPNSTSCEKTVLQFPRKNEHVILGFFGVSSKESGDSVPRTPGICSGRDPGPCRRRFKYKGDGTPWVGKVEDAKPNHPKTARRTGEFL